MAADQKKLEEKASVLRFYKIVLSWDYFRIYDEFNVLLSRIDCINTRFSQIFGIFTRIITVLLGAFGFKLIVASFLLFTVLNLICFFFFLLKGSETEQDEDAIGLKKRRKTNQDEGAIGLKMVKNTYKDVDDYLDTYEPLLFEEVKSQILQTKDNDDEDNDDNKGEHSKRVCQQAMVTQCSEVDGFHLPMVICSEPEAVRQNDLLLISNEKVNLRPKAYAFALVEHRQQDKIRLRLYLDGEVKRFNTDEIQSCPRLFNMRSIVGEEKKVFFIEKMCCSRSAVYQL